MSNKPNGGLSITIALMFIVLALNLVFIGIPGIFVFIAGDELPSMLLDKFHGDNVWPIGFVMGVLWPPGIPVSYIIAKRIGIPTICGSFPAFFRGFIFVGALYAWVAAMATACHIVALSGDVKVN